MMKRVIQQSSIDNIIKQEKKKEKKGHILLIWSASIYSSILTMLLRSIVVAFIAQIEGHTLHCLSLSLSIKFQYDVNFT